jgi:hypothetical protein
MKKLFLLMVLVPTICLAQSTYRTGYGTPGAFSFGVGADFALPITEGFKDVYDLGIGGTARGEYAFTPDLSVMLTAGYISMGAKEINGIKPDAASMIPIVAGLKYYFMPGTLRFYGAFDLGITMFKVNVPSVNVLGVQIGGGSETSSEFTYQPQLGMLGYFSDKAAFDVAVRWIGISDANSLGIRFGVLFDL